MSTITYVLTTNGLLFLLSIVFWKFPPKKINNLYGYRTFKATQNQDIWDFANSNFNKTLLFYSGFSFIGGLLLAYFSVKVITWEPMVLVMLAVIVSIIKTERAINDNFTDEGKRKKK